ncbi:MAG: glycosyltransferase family 9 protein [candidate division Zixibacteria bacterium]|nr:glycosyltransferase family 9 protein [candidate division Zixibacteria bacterium]
MATKIEIKKGDKILISRSDKLGDLILALPFVETMKKRYPECDIDVLTSLYASPIIENNDHIRKIIRVQNDQLFKDNLYKRDLLQKLKKENYSIVIVLYPERYVSRLFYKADIPIRIGTARRFNSVFYNHFIYHSRKENKKHECQYNLDFLKLFKDGETVTQPNIYLRDKEIKNARRILKEVNISSDFILIHPGSGGSAESWPMVKFMKLSEHLKSRNYEVVFSGSDSESEMIKKISAQMKFDIKSIAGETDLRTLGAVLSLAKVVVANSTGPLHLAAALNTKVVGLYPSRKLMSPVRWGPIGDNHKVIMPPIKECQCPSDDCKCMEQISEESLCEEIIASFNGN